MPGLKLEVFQTEKKTPSGATVVMEIGVFEDTRLESYDSGYSAGWDDAMGVQSDEQSRMGADLARNIQTLGFTYQEARLHVLRAVEPLLLGMIDQLLPDVAREALGPRVLDLLMPIAAQAADEPVTLVINPAARSAVEALLDRSKGLPITILDEPTLGEGQVYLRSGNTETRVDLDRVTADIATAVRDFFELSRKDRKYG